MTNRKRREIRARRRRCRPRECKIFISRDLGLSLVRTFVPASHASRVKDPCHLGGEDVRPSSLVAPSMRDAQFTCSADDGIVTRWSDPKLPTHNLLISPVASPPELERRFALSKQG